MFRKLFKSDNPLHGSGNMTTQDIVKKSAEKYYPDEDWEKIYAFLHEAIASNQFRMFRHHNSLLLYHINGKNMEHMYLFTTDTAHDLVKAFKAFAIAAKTAGFEKVITDVLDPQVIRVARLAKLKVSDKSVAGGHHLEITL